MCKIETNTYMRNSFPVSNDYIDQERYMYTNEGRIQDLWLGGGVSRRGVWGPLNVPQRVVGRALVGDPGGKPPS